MATNCYFDTNGCYVCPEIPSTPAVPPTTTISANAGWNAGANSISMLGGDVYMAESLSTSPVGIVIGFKTTRLNNTTPSSIDHGFYLYTLGPTSYIAIMERGVQQGNPWQYPIGARFEIRRSTGTILYRLNNTFLMQSRARSPLPYVVNSCLYAAGDALP